jgi:integrase
VVGASVATNVVLAVLSSRFGAAFRNQLVRRTAARPVGKHAACLLGSGATPLCFASRALLLARQLNSIQTFYRLKIDSDGLIYNPSARTDLPKDASARPSRIATPAEAAALLAALPAEDRPVWATAFYAGLRRGELQALRVCDIDLDANPITVERGWAQVEGVIDPKSTAGRRCWRSCVTTWMSIC